MNIARFNGGRIGVVIGDRIHDVSEACGVDPSEWPPMGMITTIAAFDELRPGIERDLGLSVGQPLTSVSLETPIPWPHKVLVAGSDGFFMKSNAALSGPAEAIVIPELAGRTFHYEGKLAIVVGKTARNVAAADALDYVFGYACLIDVTMRGEEAPAMRKSFDTFCPVGPWIVTADEGGPSADAAAVREAIARCSAVSTLQPGDIVAADARCAAGSIAPGDAVRIAIENVGEMTVSVVAGAPATAQLR